VHTLGRDLVFPNLVRAEAVLPEEERQFSSLSMRSALELIDYHEPVEATMNRFLGFLLF
jgi:hypothetical protein